MQQRIGWPNARRDVDPRRVPSALHAAQRAHLEQRLLFGQRKANKRG